MTFYRFKILTKSFFRNKLTITINYSIKLPESFFIISKTGPEKYKSWNVESLILLVFWETKQRMLGNTN